MKENNKVFTRRDFIRASSCLAAGSIMGFSLLGNSPINKSKKSQVVLVRDKNVFDGQGLLNPNILQDMLDRAVTALFRTADHASAWKLVVKPTDIVGIKTNVWSYLPTPKPIEKAIQTRLMEAGVKEENIAADDRGVLENPVFKQSTVLINVRPMRTHHWAGLGTLLKNYIMFVPTPSKYHHNACEGLGSIWRLPHVADKTRLNILVLLTPLFHGVGPHHFSSRYTWRYCGLVVSTDPVAADATGARIIQAKRNAFFGMEKPISPPPRHIAAADTKFGLGKSQPEQIELVKLGWEEDIFV